MLSDSVPSLAHAALSKRLSISLKAPESDGDYPTSKLQKGPTLVAGIDDLCGGGVGLGVPIAKCAHRAVFPGGARLTKQRADNHLCTRVVDYDLNLEERVTSKSGDTIRNDSFYRLKERFADLHKVIPISRGLIENFNRAFRFTWGLGLFEATSSAGIARVSYTVDRASSLPLDYLSFTMPYPLRIRRCTSG